MSNSYKIFKELLIYAIPWRARIIWAVFCSIMNKLFDIMPEILIGFAVDLVIKQQNSFIASLGVINLFWSSFLLYFSGLIPGVTIISFPKQSFLTSLISYGLQTIPSNLFLIAYFTNLVIISFIFFEL